MDDKLPVHAPEPESILRILHTKLMLPRLHPVLVRRTALFARLEAGLTRKVTLVSASTGFGKTTLVSAWLADRNIPTAWVTLDENDNDPVRFWTYTLSALRGIDAMLGKTALSMLSASSPPTSFQPVLTLLINDLTRLTGPHILVLEDYHTITSNEIHEALIFLLQHLPEHLHLVLISRTEPDLPLGTLRARDELVEIDAADLRFSQAETDAFLREALQDSLPPGAAEKLQERTDGWAAGLRLASLALQNKGGQDAERVIASFSGSHRYVADYLTQEVFASQPEVVQSFLLSTCFLSRLTGALCDSITGASNGDAMLAQLERQNLFIVQLTTGGGRSWYRYNPLFAESIQGLARQRLGEAGVRAIFEKASVWYEYQQMFDDAIETALAAAHFERAIALVERFVEIYNLSEMHTLTRWLERIPLALTLQHPTICMTYAMLILFSSDRYAAATMLRIEPYLQAAEQVWRVQGNDEKVGTVLALRGMMLLWQGDFKQSLACVEQALEMMAENEVFWRGVSLLNAAGGDMNAGRMSEAQDKILEARAFLGASQNFHGMLATTSMLSEIFYLQGNLEQATLLAGQLMTDAVGDESMLDDQGDARRILANISYEQNDLKAAEQYAIEARAMARQRNNELLEAQAQSQLASIYAAQGNETRAHDELLTLAARLNHRLAYREVQDSQALLALRTGQLESLNRWQTLIETESENLLYQQRQRETCILARLRIAEGRSAGALALLAPLPADAAHSLTQALCIQALAHRAAGDLSGAKETLAHALEIGHQKGFRRIFLDEGASMAALLRELILALPNRTLSLYAGTLLHLFPPETASTRQGTPISVTLVEPLSGQEVRVLRLLVAGLSNGEIASELVISGNTVKTHIKNIYRKLNVNARDEARLVAKELKLL